MRFSEVLIVLCLFVGLSCSSDEGKPVGTEGGPCYGNGTCNPGLTCASQLCVALGDASTDVEQPKADAGPDVDASPSDTAPPEDASEDEGSPDAQPDAPTIVPTPGPWVSLPAGTFTMGSPSDEPCRDVDKDDEDLHEVTLTHPFEIQSTEVTQDQFEQLMGYNPAKEPGCDACPVDTVSWHEAAAYCNALSTGKGLASCYKCTGATTSVSCSQTTAYADENIYACPGFRLPTDAEWEYAYRAGTTTAYYNGPNDPAKCDCQKDAYLDAIAWYCSTAGGKAKPVGQKMKNAWHLYDMAGNVYEWCNDRYTESLGTAPVTDPVGPSVGNFRVRRGGAAGWQAQYARAANRAWQTPGYTSSTLGFRCVKTITP